MATKKAVPDKTTNKAATPEKAPEKTPSTPAAKMTKTQIVKAMAEKLEAEPKQIQAFFDALVEMTTQQTREVGEFTIPGLGKLVKAERKERMGRNPATGEQLKIAAKTTVKFRIAKSPRTASHHQRRSCRNGRKLFAMNRLRPIRNVLSSALVAAK